ERHAAAPRGPRDRRARVERHGDCGNDRQAPRLRARARRRRRRGGDRRRTEHEHAGGGRDERRTSPRHAAGPRGPEGARGGSRAGMTMTTAVDEVVARESRYVLQTYKRNPITLVRGNGVRVYDADGKEYFDLLSGIGVVSLGHAHAGLARAVAEQAQTLIHTSNLFYHPYQGQVAERLSQLSGLPRAFICNSGTEANEACLKFARRYWYTKGEPRAEFVALDESFHG